MKGLSPQRIPILVENDVNVVKKNAKVVINISKLGLSYNQDGGLGIIAIIGPGEFYGRRYEETVLCEIGLGRSRPYHSARKSKRWIEKRRKWFSLTEEQYLVVAPIVFDILQKFADEYEKRREMRRKEIGRENQPYLIPVVNNRYFNYCKFRGVQKRKNLILKQFIFMPAIERARFAICVKDELFLRDIYFAELNQNDELRWRLKGFIRFVDKSLSRYKKGFSRSFDKLGGVKDIERCILRSSLSRSPYLMVEALKYLNKGAKNPLYPYYVECLIPWDGEPTRERQLADSALPKVVLRLGGIKLRVTTGLNGENKYKIASRDHIVFEVSPSNGNGNHP